MIYEIERTKIFDKWLNSLRDRQAVQAINKRLARLEIGNFGDHKQLTEGLFELRFFLGPGYRIYYTIKKQKIILLLTAGDKSSQQKNIDQALAIIRAYKEV